MKKFKDRATAVSAGSGKRFRASARLAPGADEAAPVPEEWLRSARELCPKQLKPEAGIPESTDPARCRARCATVARRRAGGGSREEEGHPGKENAHSRDPEEAGAPREGSKTSQVIAMLKREGGTTLEEIMTAMGWQKHTTRAMLSAGGSLTKNHGLVVTSEKVGDKRVYSIKA